MDSGHFIAGKNVESLVSQQEFVDAEYYEDNCREGAEGEVEIDTSRAIGKKAMPSAKTESK